MKSSYFVYLLEKKMFEEWIGKKAHSLITEEDANNISLLDFSSKNSYNVYVVADRLNYSFSQFIKQFGDYSDFEVGWKILHTNSDKIHRKYMLYMDKDYVSEFEDECINRTNIRKYKQAKHGVDDIIEAFEDLYSIYSDMKEKGWYFSLSRKYKKIVSQINSLRMHVIKKGFLNDYKNTIKNLKNQINSLTATYEQNVNNERKIKEYTLLLGDNFNITPHKSDEIYIPEEVEGLPALVLRMRKKGMSDLQIIEKLIYSHHLDRPVLGALIYPKNDRIADYGQVFDNELKKHGLIYDKKAYRLVKEEDKKNNG